MVNGFAPLAQLINRFETTTRLAFRPSREFFQGIQINAHRFALLRAGSKHPDSEEIKRIVHFFNQFFPVTTQDLL